MQPGQRMSESARVMCCRGEHRSSNRVGQQNIVFEAIDNVWAMDRTPVDSYQLTAWYVLLTQGRDQSGFVYKGLAAVQGGRREANEGVIMIADDAKSFVDAVRDHSDGARCDTEQPGREYGKG
ncbi:hypothetical protein XH98_16410 [Bradyrhizobium sp. CCBAU 51745]|nr:hypothetical protein [Bradyrhizobium sp. CCBAU 51745]